MGGGVEKAGQVGGVGGRSVQSERLVRGKDFFPTKSPKYLFWAPAHPDKSS